jgi:hypothetical protein
MSGAAIGEVENALIDAVLPPEPKKSKGQRRKRNKTGAKEEGRGQAEQLASLAGSALEYSEANPIEFMSYALNEALENPGVSGAVVGQSDDEDEDIEMEEAPQMPGQQFDIVMRSAGPAHVSGEAEL